MSVGMNIKRRRKQIGMSAETLADRLGLSPSTIYRYEKGEIEKVDSAIIPKIAEALNTTPAEIMGWEDTEPEDAMPSPEEWKLLHGLRKMPSNEAKIIMNMILGAINSERNDDDDPES